MEQIERLFEQMVKSHKKEIIKFQEQMFRKQEKNVIKRITGNTAFTKQRLEVLNKEVTDLKKKLKFTKNNTEDKITDFKEKLASEEKNMESLGDYVKVIQSMKLSLTVDIENMLVDLEDRSRRNSLKIDGIKKHGKKAWGIA